MLKSIFGHVKTVVTLGNNENNYNMLFEDSHCEFFFYRIFMYFLLVKTAGREGYEKENFTKVNKEVRGADSKRMHATLLIEFYCYTLYVVV